MNSNFIKKIIASTLIFSLTLSVGVNVINKPQIAQAEDYDSVRTPMKSISISAKTTFRGRPAVTIKVPAGMKIKDVSIDNEPHDDIDEILQGDTVIIYGLRNGVNYNNLVLELEGFNNVDYYYTIAPFSINGTSQNSSTNPVAPQNTQALQDYLRNVYKNVFNREIDNQGLNYWTNKLATDQIDLEDFFKNLLSENEFRTVAPTVEAKIKKLYVGIFQREADQGGFNFWVSKYREELREEGNEREALREVIDSMTDGQEFKQLLIKLGLND